MENDVFQPASGRVLAGAAREDITPPLGIYSRCWGASLHETASSVHHPFTVTAAALQAADGDGTPHVVLAVDLCWFEEAENNRFLDQVRAATELSEDQLIVNLGHSHAALNLSFSLSDKPGGDKIIPYFELVVERSISAIHAALAEMQPAWLTADYGHCSLAVNRNYVDDASGEVLCGFNPHEAADDTLAYVRVAADDGMPIASFLNYGCHPTTLGPANEALSTDYIGAARATVEEAFGGLCLFLISACGDTAPREGYSGDTRTADSNGRQLGYAAASVAESLLPPGEALGYTGPVLSGATLATWERRKMDPTAVSGMHSARLEIELPLRARVDADVLAQRERDCLDRLAAAESSGDALAIRDATAMVERARRNVLREPLRPSGDTLTLSVWVWQLGRIAFVAMPAEPYGALQTAIRARFRELCIIIAMNSNGTCGYLMPEEEYGRGLYQEWASPTGKGGFERIRDAIIDQLAAWNPGGQT
jgi:hypothetical protein